MVESRSHSTETLPVVTVSCRGNRGAVDPRTVRRRALRLLALTGRPEGELSVLLCDDDFITRLNSEYRDRNAATDVLSFSMDEGPVANPNPHVLGDVVISVETARHNAAVLGRSTIEEVTSLLVHGVLHLLGYRHGNQRDSRRMFAESARLEDALLGRHG